MYFHESYFHIFRNTKKDTDPACLHRGVYYNHSDEALYRSILLEKAGRDHGCICSKYVWFEVKYRLLPKSHPLYRREKVL